MKAHGKSMYTREKLQYLKENMRLLNYKCLQRFLDLTKILD